MVIDTVCGWNHTRRSNIIYSYLLPKDSLHFERIISITNGQIYPSCHYPNRISLVHWSYLGCFILACSYQAGLVRHVPHNYNEARSIMLAMMAITVEIVIVIPAFYVSIWSRYRYLTYTLVSFFMATNTLCFVFLSRLYIMFFRPWENAKQLPLGTLGGFELIEKTSVFDEVAPCKTRQIQKTEKRNETSSIQSKLPAFPKFWISTGCYKNFHCNITKIKILSI